MKGDSFNKFCCTPSWAAEQEEPMVIEWKKAESTVRPREVDYESSPTTVYLHRKIKEKERKAVDSDETVVYYEYEEAKLTPAEYTVYAAEQARQDNLAIMEALADIYAAEIGG